MGNQLNGLGSVNAGRLVAAGKISDDPWSFNASDGNAILGSNNDWSAYSKVHLGIKPGFPQDTKQRYSYPVIKNGKIYKRAVANAESRASAQGDTAIANRAKELFNAIQAKEGSNQNLKFSLSSNVEFSQFSSEEGSEGSESNITGFAVHVGTFNDLFETPESELENVASSIQGAQLRKDHGRSIDDVIGRVKNAAVETDPVTGVQGVKYNAFIDDPSVSQKLSKGLIGDVSIGFRYFPACSECGEDFRFCEHGTDEAHIITQDMSVHELSLVVEGADSDAYAQPGAFMAEFRDKLEKIEKEKFTENKEKSTMAEKDSNFDANSLIEELSAVKADNKILAAEKDGLEAKFTQQKSEIESKDSKITELTAERDDYKEKFEKKSEELETKEKAEKEAFVKDIVDEKITKGIIKAEEKDAEIEKLSKHEMGGLSEIADIVKAYVPEVYAVPNPSEVGGIANVQNPHVEDEEFNDKEVKKQSIWGAFSRPEVLRQKGIRREE